MAVNQAHNCEHMNKHNTTDELPTYEDSASLKPEQIVKVDGVWFMVFDGDEYKMSMVISHCPFCGKDLGSDGPPLHT